MKASILAQVLEQYKAFCSLSRRDKMTHVGLLLLGLALVARRRYLAPAPVR